MIKFIVYKNKESLKSKSYKLLKHRIFCSDSSCLFCKQSSKEAKYKRKLYIEQVKNKYKKKEEEGSINEGLTISHTILLAPYTFLEIK